MKNSLEFEKRFALILIKGCLWLTRGLSTLGMKADKQLAISHEDPHTTLFCTPHDAGVVKDARF